MAAVAVRRRFRSAILGDYDAGGRVAGRASQLVLVGHRTVQPYLEKVGFDQAGTAHVGRAQAGVARDGAARVGLAQVRLGEVGVAQVGLEQPRIPQRWDVVREEHQRLYSERRKVKREKSRRGLFLPPLHDDDAEPDVSLSEKLKTALAESKKHRQRRL